MLKLQVVVNGYFEDQRVLINVDSKNVVFDANIEGEYNHSWQMIDAFLDGLSYAGVEYKLVGTIWVSPGEELHQICGFYGDE